jgi:hypothetical protein
VVPILNASHGREAIQSFIVLTLVSLQKLGLEL